MGIGWVSRSMVCQVMNLTRSEDSETCPPSTPSFLCFLCSNRSRTCSTPLQLVSIALQSLPCSTMQYHHPQKNTRIAPDAIRFILHTAWCVGGTAPVCSNHSSKHSSKGPCHTTGRFVQHLQPPTVDTTTTSSTHSSFDLGSFAHAHPSMEDPTIITITITVTITGVAPTSNSILHQA